MRKLFIHIPKNGGMTIRHPDSNFKNLVQEVKPDLLKNKEYRKGLTSKMKKIGHSHRNPAQHARYIDVKETTKNEYIAFAIVRNPWDRVVSRYCFGKKQKLLNISFEDFIQTRFEFDDIGRDYTWHLAVKGWFPAYDYVTDEHGNIKCDIMRFENYNEDLVKYFKFPKDTVLDIRNVSNGIKAQNRKSINSKRPYQEFYNNKTIQIIADWYKDDIETWGYDFDTGPTKNFWNQE